MTSKIPAGEISDTGNSKSICSVKHIRVRPSSIPFWIMDSMGASESPEKEECR